MKKKLSKKQEEICKKIGDIHMALGHSYLSTTVTQETNEIKEAIKTIAETLELLNRI